MALQTKSRAVELLLTDEVPNLGTAGDVVKVKPGYARNYLLPYGLATVPSAHAMKMVERRKAELRAAQAARVARLKETAAALAKQSVTIEVNVNPEGHLYGSVGATEISAALKKLDFPVEPDNVRLKGPLRELALYTVDIHLAPEVDTQVKVWVVPSERPLLRQLNVYAQGHKEAVELVLPQARLRLDKSGDRFCDIGVYLSSKEAKPAIPDRVPELMFEALTGEGHSPEELEEKRKEYHRAGVREYVLIDREKHEATVLTWAHKGYQARVLSADDTYATPLLPGFSVPLREVF